MSRFCPSSVRKCPGSHSKCPSFCPIFVRVLSDFLTITKKLSHDLPLLSRRSQIKQTWRNRKLKRDFSPDGDDGHLVKVIWGLAVIGRSLLRFNNSDIVFFSEVFFYFLVNTPSIKYCLSVQKHASDTVAVEILNSSTIFLQSNTLPTAFANSCL